MDILPDELIREISIYLPIKDFLNLISTSKINHKCLKYFIEERKYAYLINKIDKIHLTVLKYSYMLNYDNITYNIQRLDQAIGRIIRVPTHQPEMKVKYVKKKPKN